MNGRIIILDDDEDTLEVLSDILQDEGYEVHRHDLLFEDLSEVERISPDLIIADLFMGARRAGWEFLQRLQAHPPTALIPLILCTAGQLTPEEEYAAQQQGISIVYKPFDLDELTHLVTHLLGSAPLVAEGMRRAE
jgi:CheY-like chemotaxis protein